MFHVPIFGPREPPGSPHRDLGSGPGRMTRPWWSMVGNLKILFIAALGSRHKFSEFQMSILTNRKKSSMD